MLPLVTKCHTHYHLHPFHFVLFKVKDLVAKQHPTYIHTYTFKNHLAQFSPDRLAVVKHMVVMVAVFRHVEECLHGDDSGTL